MKILLISDQHFGSRNENDALDYHFEKFYTDFLFPYLDQRGDITDVIDLGDTFDRRRYINFKTLFRAKKYWFDPLIYERGYNLDILLGNHTIYYKNTNIINSVSLLLGEYEPNLTVISDPRDIFIGEDQFQIGFLPWILPSNYDESMRYIDETTSKIIVSHLELNGFLMNQGLLCSHGMDRNMFNKFSHVFTGHFHKKHSSKNIHYLGSPYQMCWSDHGNKHGVHIFDTETLELEFVENPNPIFLVFEYRDDKDDPMKILEGVNLERIFVRVDVGIRKNPVLFDKFITKIESMGPEDVVVSENYSHFNSISTDNFAEEASQNTMQILEKCIDSWELKGIDKDKVKNLAQTCYTQAMASKVTV